jgi:hypothetical protein
MTVHHVFISGDDKNAVFRPAADEINAITY